MMLPGLGDAHSLRAETINVGFLSITLYIYHHDIHNNATPAELTDGKVEALKCSFLLAPCHTNSFQTVPQFINYNVIPRKCSPIVGQS